MGLLSLTRVLFALIPVLFSMEALAQSYTLTTFAGADRLGEGKQALTVPFRYPYGTAQDVEGNIYVADRDDHRIRRISPTGVLTTVAGTGRSGFSGDNGPATSAQLNGPTNIRLDGKGNLFIADYDNEVIRKVNLTTGIISTVVGSGAIRMSGDGGPATAAGIDPYDFAIDSDGNLYISDTLNHRIRKVNADGVISTITGTSNPGFTGDNSSAEGSAIRLPLGIAVDAQKNVYFADYGNIRIRKITAATGKISTVAGNGFFGYSGDGGQATSARIYEPTSVAIEANGDILIAGRDEVRRVTVATGIIRLMTGSVNYGYAGDGGPAINGVWGIFNSVTVAPNGDILMTDPFNFRVRRVRANILSTVAGSGLPPDGLASTTYLNSPSAMTFNSTGGIWFADTLFHEVRSIDGGRVTRYFGDGYPLTATTRVDHPAGVARDASGALLVSDSGNHRVMRYVPNQNPSIVAGGNGPGKDGEFVVANGAKLDTPMALAMDTDGTLYIADTGNCRVRRVFQGTMNTFAGVGSCAYSGDGGPAKDAGMTVGDIALDGRGGLLIADSFNHRVRRVDIATGMIRTIAGDGTLGSAGDGGSATAAQLNVPIGVAADSAGRIYISEFGGSVVRMVAANGTIRTIAGTGKYVSDAESGAARAVSFDPGSLLVAPDGTIYVSDAFNDRIRKLTPAILTSLQVLEGANVTADAGSKVTLKVKTLEGSGLPISDIPVRFTISSGGGELSSISVNSTVEGIAQVQLTLPNAIGPVVVTASADNVAPVTMRVTGTIPQPRLDDAAVVGAGLSIPSVRALSHGAILSAFGRNFGVGSAYRKVGEGDLVNGKVPTSFAGLCVDVNGVRAPLYGASDTQVNFQAPAGLSGIAAVKILIGCGTANETATNPISVPVQSASPEFFYFATSIDGHNPVAAANAVTGALVGPATLFPGSGIVPAKPGDILTVYGTGFGDTNPSFAPGEFPGSGGQAKGRVRVLLKGEELPAVNVLYAGVTPFSPGLYQLNLQIPLTTRAGDWSLVIEIDGIQSPAGAYLSVAP